MNVSSGYSALDLVGFTDKGDYSPSATYVKNDLVHYNGAIWKCLIDDTTGIVPTTGVNWDIWIDQSTSLDGLTDVEITSPTDGQEVTYDATTQKWKNTSKIQTLTNQVKDMNNVLGAKNLLPYPYDQTTKTVNGVTFTDNGDGTITLNGTNTATNTVFMLHQRAKSKTAELFSRLKKMNTSFKLLGGINSLIVWVVLDFYDSSGTYISSIMSKSDTPTQFTIPSNVEDIDIFIRCGVDAVYSNLTIYPMLYLASITDDTYEPYAKTNQQLTQDTTGLLDNLEVNGAVNLCENVFTSQVIKDVTFTKNSNGSLTVRGTASGNITTTNYSGGYIFNTTLKAGTYKLSVGQATKRIYYRLNDGSPISVPVSGMSTFTVDTDDTAFKVWFYCNSGVVANETYYPMLTVASYNGDYAPYAKSNKELTEDAVKYKEVTLTYESPVTLSPNTSGRFYITDSTLYNSKLVGVEITGSNLGSDIVAINAIGLTKDPTIARICVPIYNNSSENRSVSSVTLRVYYI